MRYGNLDETEMCQLMANNTHYNRMSLKTLLKLQDELDTIGHNNGELTAIQQNRYTKIEYAIMKKEDEQFWSNIKNINKEELLF